MNNVNVSVRASLFFHLAERYVPTQVQCSKVSVKTSPGHKAMASSVPPMVVKTSLFTSQSRCINTLFVWTPHHTLLGSKNSEDSIFDVNDLFKGNIYLTSSRTL